MMLRQLFICALFLRGADAFPAGAGPQACAKSNMNPSGHTGATASGDSSPYSVNVDAEQYGAGDTLTVTLQGTQSFKGFLILALPFEDDTAPAIGSFVVESSADSTLVKQLCDGGLTHTKAFGDAVKDKIVLKWTAPSTLAGNIIFQVTFVRKFDTFWVKVPSVGIWNGDGPRPVTTDPSAPTDPPPIAPVSNADCAATKSCYHDCQDDGNMCGFLLTWTKTSEDLVEFEMFAALDEDANENYVALGLSTNPRMTDVSIIGCSADGRRRSSVEQFYAINRTVPTFTAEPIVVIDTDASVQTTKAPKSISCRFTYDNKMAKTHDQWKDLAQPLFAFIARGPYETATLLKHTLRPKISPRKVSFLSSEKIELTGSRIEGWVKAHACIMILAWVFCASVGLILARYYKPMWEDSKACGEKVWFSYHRALMLSAMFLTIIGFVCILVYKEGIYTVKGLELPHKAHPILGLIAIISSLLNPLIAAFRCHPGDSKRPIFNWLHWFFGTVAHVFAIVAIFLGMLFESVVLPAWITYIMMAFCLFHVCVEFILEIHQCCMYDKNRDRQEYQKANGKGPKYAGHGFKCAMLAVYVIVVSLITIALVVIVAVWGSTKETYA